MEASTMTKRGMMDQFFDLKEQHPDTVLFFRMGDFYELFHDDAALAAEVLGLSLTSRDKNAEEPIPMAGFPWHGLEDHLRTMLRAGYKVTVAEQEEELRPGAKLLERVATRVYTPGSLYEEGLLNGDEQSLLAAVVLGTDALGLAVIDASTGKAWASTHAGSERMLRLQDELLRWQPSELVVSPKDASDEGLGRLFPLMESTMVSQHKLSPAKRDERLRAMLNVADLGHLDLDHAPLAISATGLAADYLATVHLQPDVPLQDVELVEEQGHLLLDQTTLRNLELTSTLAGEYDGSLLSSLNKCRTAMGRRLLRHGCCTRFAIKTPFKHATRRLEPWPAQLVGWTACEPPSTAYGTWNVSQRNWPTSEATHGIWWRRLMRWNGCRPLPSGAGTAKTRC